MVDGRSIALWMGLLALTACPGQGNDDGGVTSNSGPSSASNEDGPEPATCEQRGGQCACVGSCEPGQMPTADGACPQPAADAGACGQECCVPITGSTAGSTATTTGTADGTADTAAPVCDCAMLPECSTPPDEDCGGQYPTGHCCDAQAEAMTCSCIDPCDGGFPCCSLQPGCT